MDRERTGKREGTAQGEQLIHHKLRNKEKRGCVETAPEYPQTPASSRRNFTYLLNLAGRNCLRYWHRTVPHTYDLLNSRPPPDFYFPVHSSRNNAVYVKVHRHIQSLK